MFIIETNIVIKKTSKLKYYHKNNQHLKIIDHYKVKTFNYFIYARNILKSSCKIYEQTSRIKITNLLKKFHCSLGMNWSLWHNLYAIRNFIITIFFNFFVCKYLPAQLRNISSICNFFLFSLCCVSLFVTI